MKFAEIKDQTVNELNKKIKTIKGELFELRMKNSLGQVNNPLKIRGLRRDVARVLTAINQKLGN
jgi:large subunit ribosomal protein L29